MAITAMSGCTFQQQTTNQSPVMAESTPGEIPQPSPNQVDDWFYYACGSDGIYKINSDGTQNTKINDDYSDSVQVYNDWLYYYDCDNVELIKTRLDGSERTVVLAGVTAGHITVEGDWIYCLIYDLIYFSKRYEADESFNQDECWRLIRIRTDGTEETSLVDGFAGSPSIIGDWIYYLDGYSNIFKIRKDGTVVLSRKTYTQSTDGIHITPQAADKATSHA